MILRDAIRVKTGRELVIETEISAWKDDDDDFTCMDSEFTRSGIRVPDTDIRDQMFDSYEMY